MTRLLLLASASLLVLASLATARAQETFYRDGTRALNQQRWDDAVTAFNRVAQSRGKRADAALYWKAYSLSKLGKPTLASATCVQLHNAYSGSTWNKDCAALNLQLGQPGVTLSLNPAELQNLNVNAAELQRMENEVKNIHVDVPAMHFDLGHDRAATDADLKLLALNSLMNREPARAIPILRNLLASGQPDDIKQHALFVLGQSNAPEAQQLMHDLITGRVNPSLQLEAIQMTATEGRRANDTLEEVYRSSTKPEIKEAVTSALFVSGDAPRLVKLAREEKDLNRKRDIVSKLALMQDKAATDYMLELLR